MDDAVAPTQDTAAPPGRLRWQFARLALKELREILRDRRTIITLVAMPLFVYPLLGVVVQKFLLTSLTRINRTPVYRVGFETPLDAVRFREILRITGSSPDGGDSDEPAKKDDADRDSEVSAQNDPQDPFAGLLGAEAPPRFELLAPDNDVGVDLEKLVADATIDVGLRTTVRKDDEDGDDARDRPRGPPDQMRNALEIELIVEEGSRFGRDARDAVRRRIEMYNQQWWRRQLRRRGLSTDAPLQIATSTVAPLRKGGLSLVTFIPLALILMTVTGAVYPAIDLTAGERERGTLETLIAAPVPRLSLLLAKFVAVLAVAMITAMINLAAMLMTLFTVGLEQAVFGDGGMSVGVIVIVVALLFVFAAFFSAVLLCLTSFARSFKEAQAYLIPLMLVSIAPGILSLMPDIETNFLLALVPLVNVVLVGRDVLQGTGDPALLGTAMAATILYGLLALVLAARVFGTDAILYGSEGTWTDLFRRPRSGRVSPSLASGLAGLMLLFPLFIVLGSAAGRLGEIPIQTRLALNACVLLLFVLVPTLFAWWNHNDFRHTFGLRAPRVAAIVGIVLLGVSSWAFVYEATISLISAERRDELMKLGASIDLGSVPLVWRLAALAIIPGVCEEWFFRGFLLTSLRNGKQTGFTEARAIIVSAALFAAFHVVVFDRMFFERFLPSMMMGLLLGWVRVRTGSLFPGMMLHVIHNGLLLAAGDFETQLAALGLDGVGEEHLPSLWLGGATVLFIAGLLLVRRATGPEESATTEPTAEDEADELNLP